MSRLSNLLVTVVTVVPALVALSADVSGSTPCPDGTQPDAQGKCTGCPAGQAMDAKGLCRAIPQCPPSQSVVLGKCMPNCERRAFDASSVMRFEGGRQIERWFYLHDRRGSMRSSHASAT